MTGTTIDREELRAEKHSENATAPTALEQMMNHIPPQILATLDSARSVADQLRARLSTQHDVMDLGDLTHIQTTIKQIEELLGAAAEYEEILRNRLEKTAAGVANSSGMNAADAPLREVGFRGR